MKYLILTLITLASLFMFASCQREKEREEFRAKKLGKLVQLAEDKFLYLDLEYFNKNLPQILSNNLKYSLDGLSKQEKEKIDLSPYLEKIKEYMGEGAFDTFKDSLVVESFYYDENKKIIPITFYTSFYYKVKITSRFSSKIEFVYPSSVFYLENGKFIKSNEKIKDKIYEKLIEFIEWE